MWLSWTRVSRPKKPVLLVTPEYFFLGPDNGLSPLPQKADTVKQAMDQLTTPKFFLPDQRPFHAGIFFAPVAAHLTLAIRPGVLVAKLESWVKLDLGEPVATVQG